MKKDIILAGVGGQGILSIAAIIGMAAVNSGLHLKQSEVHGMSQRGGDVSSNLRLSSRPIFSDLIPFGGADIILSVEPMESLRYMPWLAPDGWLITNTAPHINIRNYPEMDKIMAEVASVQNHIAIDADQIAKNMDARKSANIIMLGAALPFLGLTVEAVEASIAFIFRSKGADIIQQNQNALHKGMELSGKENLALHNPA
jgi:indolepyruvate ferredoxin oxidoreductase beta subunit